MPKTLSTQIRPVTIRYMIPLSLSDLGPGDCMNRS
jgi:hypothetical protein